MYPELLVHDIPLIMIAGKPQCNPTLKALGVMGVRKLKNTK